jgi:hypothetical protein
MELFQGGQEEEEKGDEEKEQSKDPNQETYDMILNIVERSVYFLSTYDVNAQVSQLSPLPGSSPSSLLFSCRCWSWQLCQLLSPDLPIIESCSSQLFIRSGRSS